MADRCHLCGAPTAASCLCESLTHGRAGARKMWLLHTHRAGRILYIASVGEQWRKELDTAPQGHATAPRGGQCHPFTDEVQAPGGGPPGHSCSPTLTCLITPLPPAFSCLFLRATSFLLGLPTTRAISPRLHPANRSLEVPAMASLPRPSQAPSLFRFLAAPSTSLEAGGSCQLLFV